MNFTPIQLRGEMNFTPIQLRVASMIFETFGVDQAMYYLFDIWMRKLENYRGQCLSEHGMRHCPVHQEQE